jgi:hypothetical protein
MVKNTKPSGSQAQTVRREKFIELAERRTVNAIKAIRVIGKLGNRSHYDFDEADVRKIVQALTKELDALRSRMLTKGARDTIDFKL